jgi:ribose transport system permease protein
MESAPAATGSERSEARREAVRRALSHYGMLLVLILLCAFFSWSTFRAESPLGNEGAQSLAADIKKLGPQAGAVAIVVPTGEEGRTFGEALAGALADRSGGAPRVLVADPPAAREAIVADVARGAPPGVIATTQSCRDWTVWDGLRSSVPALAGLKVLAPTARYRSAFLSPSNLRNVADQIAVIAIIAAGMTMVIILGGIDLSVGSLIALSAVVAAWIIRRLGGEAAGAGAMVAASVAAIALCGAVGLFSGAMVTGFRIPPFIATLAMMQVAGGLAFIVAEGQSIYAIPASFTVLGRGETGSVPNAVILMLLVYVAAHIVMTRTRFGRTVYAVGGSLEAARLSGVPASRVQCIVYVLSGLSAGVGGVITASQLRAGAPTYGVAYELYVIAAVVVGGASLAGGEGHVFGTLVGALIIGVIRNGMNLMNVEPYTQKVVLGLVILGAVLIDMLKRRQWSWRFARR